MTRWKARAAAVKRALDINGDSLINAMLWSERITSLGFWIGRNTVALHFRWWKRWLRSLIYLCDRETAAPPAAVLSLVMLLPIPAMYYIVDDVWNNSLCAILVAIWLVIIAVVNCLIILFGVTVGSFLRSVGEIFWFAELITWIALLFAGRITSLSLLLVAHTFNGSNIKDAVIIAINTVFSSSEPNVQEQIYEYMRIELNQVAHSAELLKLKVAVETVTTRNRSKLKNDDKNLKFKNLSESLCSFHFHGDNPDLTFDYITRACRYAMSTYGHVGLKFLGILPYICNSSALSDVEALAYCSTKDGLIKTNFKWGLFKPGYAVWLTDEGSNLVIAIRGTLALQDFVSDLVAKPVEWKLPFDDSEEADNSYYVHDGMGRSACWLLGRIFETTTGGKKPVISPKRFSKIKKIEIFGHSMGAGVAALLCARLKSLHRKKIAQNELTVCCVGFGMPAVGCNNLGRELEKSVLAIVHGPDLVPRFSIRSVSRLLTEILSEWKADANANPPTQSDIAAYSNQILTPPGTILFIPEQSTNRATLSTPSALITNPHTSTYFQDLALVRNAGYNHLPQCYAMLFGSIRPGLYDTDEQSVSK